jgi:hypothetical protein
LVDATDFAHVLNTLGTPDFPSRRSSVLRRLARLIHGLAQQPVPTLSSDPWRDSTGHNSAEAKRVFTRQRSPERRSGWSSPPVGGVRGAHQRIAQFAQFAGVGSLVESDGHVLGSASHLIDAVGQVSGLVS